MGDRGKTYLWDRKLVTRQNYTIFVLLRVFLNNVIPIKSSVSITNTTKNNTKNFDLPHISSEIEDF